MPTRHPHAASSPQPVPLRRSLLYLSTTLLLAATAAAQKTVEYDRDVRPILADRCFVCHGHDDKKRAADLRLDLAEDATKERKHGRALVPGNVDQSLVWQHVTSQDPDDLMPPAKSGKRPLDAAELQTLRTWIEAGAVYQPHWSFVPPVRPEVPAVQDAAWGRNPIDAFVLAKLDEHHLQPSVDADKATWLRRLFLTVTGLPPTLDEYRAFAADTAADAEARWLDKLFREQPYRNRYAERMAVPWLDAARYADTSGIHMDAGRQIWPFRDWVLQAFRDNLPFDQFVIDQLAGDLIPDATQDQKVATGFHRCHVTTDEGGAIDAEYLVEYAVDRTATTGAVFLGLTVGCARCHEHKFDPISQEDFYRLYAFFDSNKEPGLYSQVPDSNRALEPFLVVPSQQQQQELAQLQAKLAEAREQLARPAPEEQAQVEAFLQALPDKAGLKWAEGTVTAAKSTGGAVLSVEADQSVFASGDNPDRDDHVLTLHTGGEGLRLLCLEALADSRLVNGRVGRAENGNAVLTGVTMIATSTADPTQTQPVHFTWAWSDMEQQNGDFGITNVLDEDELGWAVDAHNQPGNRLALLLSEKPFGYAGGTDLQVTLEYRSIYPRHVFGRVRLFVGALGEGGEDLLPAVHGGSYVLGPLPVATGQEAFDKAFGPETLLALDRGQKFGEAMWRHDEQLRDGVVRALSEGQNVHYVARTVYAPTAREAQLSIGSDDGFRLIVNGVEVAKNQVERGAAPDQDRASFRLQRGPNLEVLKVENSGGAAACYLRPLPRDGGLDGDLVTALLPKDARWPELEQRLQTACLLRFSPGYKSRLAQVAELEQQATALEAALPRTMVMQEMDKPRDTYVLTRGAYDHPDKNRKVERDIPASLGTWPEGAPKNRLGLAQWLVSEDDPLLARVTVNRLWEMVFGTGLVRSSEDFGNQGEWPSHPQLLDWLAVEFRESGYDVQHMLKLMLTSRTFAQSSVQSAAARAVDPEDRLLAYYPRRRLPAELVRDQALYLAGLLVEKFGGPSVKPYQPDGLWREVAMVQSNTRTYVRGMGDELWRRSLYTYYKRACPPPSMLVFDAPTREFCTIRRTTTNTPLQALVLWNDEQFVEAARVLAERTLHEVGDDPSRLGAVYRSCTGAIPAPGQLVRLQQALDGFRARYASAPDDAAQLVAVGEAKRNADIPAGELAAWTMLCSACLNLDATLCTD